MKYATTLQERAALNGVESYQRIVPGGRVVIYSEHTDGEGKNWRFWLCFQHRIDAPSIFTIRDQLYLDKDGRWRHPHGASSRRHFHSPNAAAKYAEGLQYATE